MGKTYKDLRNEPKWERIKKRTIEDVEREYEEAVADKSRRNPDPQRKKPRGMGR